MSYWLFKEEPDHYSFADLERDGETLWTGIKNPLARQNLSKVKRGERIFYYHTGKEKAVVGEIQAIGDPMQDPNDSDPKAVPKNADPKAVVVKVQAVRRWPRPVTLKRIKEEPELASWELVRISRLSVMPVTEAQWHRVHELSREQES